MPTHFEVDQFTTPQAWQEFKGRFIAVQQTIGALGLQGANESESPALLFGGGALTMNLIDSYIPTSKPFDLDIVVPDDMFTRLGRAGLISRVERFKTEGIQGVIWPTASIPLKVDVITSPNPAELSLLIDDETYSDKSMDSIMTLGGVQVLYPGVVASKKVIYKGNRLKDVAGVVKAHVVASHRGHPILQDEVWSTAVSLAVDRLKEDRVPTPAWRKVMRRGPSYPSWLRQLIDTDFAHPAFTNIPRL